MNIIIGNNKKKHSFEKMIFLIKIILTKNLSISFSINKPVSLEEVFKK